MGRTGGGLKVDFAAGQEKEEQTMRAAIPFPNLSSEIFSITVFGFDFALRWYAMAYIVGILIGWWIVVRAVKAIHLWTDSQPPMTPSQVEELLTWVIVGIILGGRLGFVLFYQPAYYLQNPAEILMLWQGGMAFHGGFLGVVLAAYVYCRRNAIPMLSAADAIAIATPPALFLGRVANFVNAELWGRPTDLPWGVIFPGQMAQDCPGIEGLCARHPSQLYEALLEGLILGALLIYLAWRRGAFRSPGLLTGLFFAGYGLGRFVVEFVRQADPQFIAPDNPMGFAVHIGGYGLTMGQLLSLPMIIAGAILIALARRRTAWA